MGLHIDKLTGIVLALFECLSVYMVARLWRKSGKKRGPTLLSRCLWTVILLVPLFGPLLYGFIKIDPGEHPYESNDYSGGASGDHNSSHHDSGLPH